MNENKQPTVLPWHRAAAKEINKALLRQNPTVSAIIARHDPMPTPLVEKKVAYLQAQHAETLRLLERALYCISLNDDTGHVIPAHVDMVGEIRAHLAAHARKGSK